MGARQTFRVVVIGGGQSGLAAGWHLLRAGLVAGRDFVILDDAAGPGGAWGRMWSTLRLFSPAEYSSLPGPPMPTPDDDALPGRDHVVAYLSDYEHRYGLGVHRPVRVTGIDRGLDASAPVVIHTTTGDYAADRVVNATGTWSAPFVPASRGGAGFPGRQLHSSGYVGPDDHAGSRVIVVGGGNSAAQIVADLAPVAETRWVTRRPPRFLPADVDGRALFQIATARRRHQEAAGSAPTSETVGDGGTGAWTPPRDHLGDRVLGDIVQVETVARARRDGALVAHRPFVGFDGADAVWDEGTRWRADTVIWATGFRPALRHLRGSGVLAADRTTVVDGIRSRRDPRLWFVGYGDWTGPASATLIGVGRTVRQLGVAVS